MQDLPLYSGLLIFGALVLSLVVVLLGRPRKKARTPYCRHDFLFTPAEWRFFSALEEALPEGLILFGKVRVGDVLAPEHSTDRSAWQRAFNKVAQLHLDFVICDRKTGQAIGAVELNDRSHTQRKRQERDAFLQDACEEAGFPLLFVPTASHYVVADLRAQLVEMASGCTPVAMAAPPRAQQWKRQGPTVCYACGAPMLLRTSTRGARAGSQFLGCSQYPRCRHTEPLS